VISVFVRNAYDLAGLFLKSGGPGFFEPAPAAAARQILPVSAPEIPSSFHWSFSQ
jgi:hypothetical protein